MDKVYCKNCYYLCLQYSRSYCFYNPSLGGMGKLDDESTVYVNNRNSENDCHYYLKEEKRVKKYNKFHNFISKLYINK